MKRVLHITGNLSVGGLQTVAVNIARHLDEHKYSVDFLVFGEAKGEYEEAVRKMGCNIIHIPKFEYKRIFHFYSQVKRVIIEYGPYDIVHAHTFFSSFIFLRAAKNSGVKATVAHSHSIQRGKESVIKKTYHIIARWLLYKYADVFLACSEEAGQFVFGKSAFAQKGHVLRNAIDLSNYKFLSELREKKRAELDLNGNFVIGSVGRLVPEKNFGFLIDIFRFLDNDNYVVLIAGDGGLYNELHKKIEDENFEKQIRLLGQRNDVNQLLSAFDVFVFPSEHEGLGLVLIEAMANGLPCIVEKKAIVSEIQKMSLCYSLDGYNAKSWANKIKEIKSERDRYDVPQLLALYDISHFKYEINRVYDELMTACPR